MKLGIMQPYFLPYIGYFQLINVVDKFVVYDNIKYTKKGWINRNRILVNGRDEYITLPLTSSSDSFYINQRRLADTFSTDKRKILNKVRENYRNAVCFSIVYTILEEILEFQNNNLFDFVFNSVKIVCNYLDISTEFIVSSTLPIDHALKAEDKVITICKQQGAAMYINPIGGMELYSKERFQSNDVDLKFLQSNPKDYPQLGSGFVSNLSILDVMMFNQKDKITTILNNEYELM